MARPSKQQKIEEILRRLPVLPRQADRVTEFATKILLVHQFGRQNRTASARSGRRKDAERGTQIRQLAKVAAELGQHIKAMSADGIARVDAHMGAGPHPHVIIWEIGDLVAACDAALRSDSSAQPAPRGQPPKDLARWVAGRAAEAYRELVGRHPSITTNSGDDTKSGKFIDLVAAIFKELDIEGSPTEWAEVACRSLRKD